MPADPRKPFPNDPLEWRPQRVRPFRTPRSITDPILEPHWTGRHVLAHFDSAGPWAGSGPVRLIDELGEEATTDHADLAEEIADALMAVDAVLDGYLTVEATRSAEGSSIAMTPRVRGTIISSRRVEVDVQAPPGTETGSPEPVAFVAVDVLRLDGEILLDLPLLERKRLLDGLLQPSERVRISPYTRPPIGPWLAAWKSNGLAGVVCKGANSRYRPDALTEEWTIVTKLPGR